jgi:hypothetical protein
MAKAELEAAKVAYDQCLSRAQHAETSRRYVEAIAHAVGAWEHVDGMMRFERKYEQAAFTSLPCVELVLKYAPLVFHVASLDQLDSLLREKRSVERHTSDDIGTKLEEATALMRAAHLLWDHVERNPESRQDQLRQRLGGNQEQWRWLAERWEAMGLFHRTQDQGSCCLRLVTRLDDRVKAKCGACGAIASGHKSSFLAEQVCPGCKVTAMFVIRDDNAQTQERE